jgi:hypothetical protein
MLCQDSRKSRRAAARRGGTTAGTRRIRSSKNPFTIRVLRRAERLQPGRQTALYHAVSGKLRTARGKFCSILRSRKVTAGRSGGLTYASAKRGNGSGLADARDSRPSPRARLRLLRRRATMRIAPSHRCPSQNVMEVTSWLSSLCHVLVRALAPADSFHRSRRSCMSYGGIPREETRVPQSHQLTDLGRWGRYECWPDQPREFHRWSLEQFVKLEMISVDPVRRPVTSDGKEMLRSDSSDRYPPVSRDRSSHSQPARTA